MRVLLFEDDTDVLDLTAYALRRYGYDVVGVTDGALAVERWTKERPDLVLLDINLPTMSGFDICREIRKRSASIPIIMVTAAGDDEHVVEGFESGADDYVVKPISYRQLASRMRVVMERHADAPMFESSAVAQSGDIWVDLAGYEVRKSGVPIRLTRLEMRVLYLLVSNAGRVVMMDRLIQFVWNYEGGDSLALKTHICHIRQKLNLKKNEPGYINSVPQVGYIMETD
jgi:DNA-binding response OmpR family regulator